MQLADFDPHRDAQLGVEIRQRLVEQKHFRLPHDGASHGDALALAAGQLPRLALEHRRDFENLRGLADARIDLGLRHAAIAQTVSHVVVDGHVRIERVVLKHHGDVAIGRLDLVDHAAADVDGAAGDGLQSRHHAQQRGLAAAGWAHQHTELSVADFEIDALDGIDPAGIGLPDIVQNDVGHHPLPIFLSRPDRARTVSASGSPRQPAAASPVRQSPSRVAIPPARRWWSAFS